MNMPISVTFSTFFFFALLLWVTWKKFYYTVRLTKSAIDFLSVE